MRIEVEVEEWMGSHDIQEEVDASARRVIDSMMRGKIERETNRGTLDTAISNAGYGVVKDMLDEADPEWFSKLGDKVREVVGDLSSYTVFHDSERDRPAFGRNARSYGADALYAAIDAHRDDIDARVAELVAGIDREWLAGAVGDAFARTLLESMGGRG